jgi:hypothetical protein
MLRNHLHGRRSRAREFEFIRRILHTCSLPVYRVFGIEAESFSDLRGSNGHVSTRDSSRAFIHLESIIQELCIEVKFEGPSPDLAHFLQGRQDDSDNSNDFFEVPQIVARAATDQSHLYMLPQNFDETVQAEIIPRPVMLPNLRTLRLANITLDMRYLLQILCMQPQLPHSKISIHLNGTTIFYGLSPHLLLDLLGRLNVDMHYEPLETYYCTDFPRYRGGPPYVDYSVGSKNLEELSRSSERLCGEASKPVNMPTPDPNHSRLGQVKFKSRPSDLECIALSLMPRARREEWIYAIAFTYQFCIADSHTVCEWVINRPAGHYDSFSSSTQTIVPILTSALYFNYEAYNPDREGDAVGMAHLLEGGLLYGHGSIEDQHLLAQFEVEHLGFDVIETRVLEPLGLDRFD